MRVNGRAPTVAAALAAAIAGAAAAWAEPLTVRIGWVVRPGHKAPLIEKAKRRIDGD